MRILVDTSVWSLALRRNTKQLNHEALILQEIIDNDELVYLTGEILTELLQGVRNKEQFEALKTYLSPFPILSFERDNYVYAAQLSNQCRNAGVQASTIDILIATAAILNKCHLLTTDKDFNRIAKVVPLKIFQ